jgi:hypothetical protein
LAYEPDCHPAYRNSDFKPRDLEAIERANANDDPFALGKLVLQLEMLPALNRMQPFTNLDLAQAVCLARYLVCNADSIPDERQVLVRRLAVWQTAV